MLENLKERILEKIENHSVKSEIEGQTVYLKKSKIPLLDEWREIHPIVNEDKTWNFGNFIFGGWRNFVKLLLILVIVCFVLFQFKENFALIDELRKACPIEVTQNLLGG